MHSLPSAQQLRLATFLIAALTASLAASASESPAKMGQVAYTAGTGTVRAARTATDVVVISDPKALTESGEWLIASLDSAIGSTPASTQRFQAASFGAPSNNRFATDAVAQGQASSSQAKATRKPLEPGAWAAALSTLALALFFFLRRLT